MILERLQIHAGEEGEFSTLRSPQRGSAGQAHAPVAPRRRACRRWAMDLDPAAALKALQSRNFGGHSARLGIRYHDRGPDWVELALPFSPDHCRSPSMPNTQLVLCQL